MRTLEDYFRLHRSKEKMKPKLSDRFIRYFIRAPKDGISMMNVFNCIFRQKSWGLFLVLSAAFFTLVQIAVFFSFSKPSLVFSRLVV